MAYDQRGQYSAPSRPYYQNRPPPAGRPPPGQAYPPANQSYGYQQDPYAAGDQGDNSYGGYDGEGFLDDYGEAYGQQNQYSQDGGYDTQQGRGQGGYGGYDQRPPRSRQQDPRAQPQQYPPQQRGYGPPMNGQGRPPPGRGPPLNFSQPLNQQQLNGGGYGSPSQARPLPGQGPNGGYGQPQNGGYGPPPPGQMRGPPPGQRRKLEMHMNSFGFFNSFPERQPLVEQNSPERLPFDNPFPAFNARPNPKTRDDGITQGMSNMDLNDRPLPRQGQPPPRKLSFPDDRGPIRRAQTMPEEYPPQDRRPQQGPNDFGRRGYDAGPGQGPVPPGYRDPVQQRSFTTLGERPPPPFQEELLPRSQSSMGNRKPAGPPNGYRRQPSWDDNMVGRGAPKAFQDQQPPQQSRGGPNQYGSQESRGYQAYGGGPSAQTKGGDLESYMPNFGSQPVKPLEDPIGLPLDAAAGMTPGAIAPDAYRQPRGDRSQPDMRQPSGPYQAAHDAPAMSRGGQTRMDQMDRQTSPPYGNGPSSGAAPVQSPPAQNQRQFGLPSNPRDNRPGNFRNQTDGSSWSDPGPNPNDRNIQAPAPIRPGLNTQIPLQSYSRDPQSAKEPQKSFNPDALPAHPAPVRPGLQNDSQPSGNTRQQQSPTTPSQGQDKNRRASSAPVTVDEINRLRATVKANPADKATELFLAKRLAAAAVTLVSPNQDAKTRTREREAYMREAERHVRKLVGQNYSEAMFYLADCYGTGQLGLAIDAKEAFALYQSAAKLGNAAAAYRTAVCCEMGAEAGGGARKDPLKAVQWYRRAATLGDVPAMYKLGMILLRGMLGQAAAPGEAVTWLQRAADAADADNPHALHELAALYETAPASGNGKIIRDERYAFELYERGARLGYRASQARLGKAFEYGQLGQALSHRSSIHWYAKAAAQGDVDAELALSGWYLTGCDGILQQSDTEAYLWARKAAMREFPKAEFAMGYFSEVGIGCPKSLEDAKRWYGRAAGEFCFLFLH